MAEDPYEEYEESDWDLDNFKVVLANGDRVVLGKPRLDIEKSGGDHFTVTVKKFSRGGSREGAQTYSKEIIYNYEVSDSTMIFDPWFVLDKGSKWRDQELKITVKVPEDKAVYLSEDMIRIIYDIENVTNTWDGDMVGKTWEMKSNGLTMKEQTTGP